MSRVLVSDGTGAAVYVFADDHCPPHVHARHRGEGWVARVGFSFVTNRVQLISVAPMRNIPLPRVINQLLADVGEALPACRNAWWTMRSTACVANRWVLQRMHTVTVLPERRPGAAQIVNATYDPASRHLEILFQDGVTLGIEAGSGEEL